MCTTQHSLYAGDTTYAYLKENGVVTKKTVVTEKILEDTPDRLSAEDAADLLSGKSNIKLVTTWESEAMIGFMPRVFEWLVPGRAHVTWQYTYNSTNNTIEENVAGATHPVVDWFAFLMRFLFFMLCNLLMLYLVIKSVEESAFKKVVVFILPLGLIVTSIVILSQITYMPWMNVLSFWMVEMFLMAGIFSIAGHKAALQKKTAT